MDDGRLAPADCAICTILCYARPMTEQTKQGWNILDRPGAVLWREYSFGPALATTLVFRGEGNGLVVVSPGNNIDKNALDELSEFGEVTALVASNGYHWLGHEPWRAHFPKARSFAPTSTLERLKSKVQGRSFEDFDALKPLLGTNATVAEAVGVKANAFANAIATVKTERGAYWYPSDLFANMPQAPANFVFRMLTSMTDSGPGYKVFRPAVWMTAKDKKTLRAWAKEQVTATKIAAVVPAHGPPVSAADVSDQTLALIDKI